MGSGHGPVDSDAVSGLLWGAMCMRRFGRAPKRPRLQASGSNLLELEDSGFSSVGGNGGISRCLATHYLFRRGAVYWWRH